MLGLIICLSSGGYWYESRRVQRTSWMETGQHQKGSWFILKTTFSQFGPVTEVVRHETTKYLLSAEIFVYEFGVDIFCVRTASFSSGKILEFCVIGIALI